MTEHEFYPPVSETPKIPPSEAMIKDLQPDVANLARSLDVTSYLIAQNITPIPGEEGTQLLFETLKSKMHTRDLGFDDEVPMTETHLRTGIDIYKEWLQHIPANPDQREEIASQPDTAPVRTLRVRGFQRAMEVLKLFSHVPARDTAALVAINRPSNLVQLSEAYVNYMIFMNQKDHYLYAEKNVPPHSPSENGPIDPKQSAEYLSALQSGFGPDELISSSGISNSEGHVATALATDYETPQQHMHHFRDIAFKIIEPHFQSILAQHQTSNN